MAISTLQCNDNEDLYLPDGRNLMLLTGQDAVVQSVRQRCKMRLGENQFNTQEGVDYFGSIFSPQPNLDNAFVSLSNAILSTPDVLSIESLTINVSDGVFNYVANITTIYSSNVEVSGAVSAT
jgi:hypothetical protein